MKIINIINENLSKLPANKKYISDDASMITEPTKDPDLGQREGIRKNSFSLLDPESTTIPSLADLSEQDYEVNAPVGSSQVLQGQDLLKALEVSSPMME
ncbi:Protein of unknown function [Gryllus bimaculatus]|nr:Protein of unknown function [Gryllus bimaculatus]